MHSGLDPSMRVLARGALTGAGAGALAGILDALWAWPAAGQFLPDVLGRLRLILYGGVSYALAGLVLGPLLTLALLALSRGTRLGDLARFAWRTHEERRAADPRDAVAGLALVLAIVPVVAICLVVAFRITGKFVAGRKAPDLVLAVTMGSSLVAVALAIPLGSLLARPIERGLRAIAGRAPRVASPYAPLVAAYVLVALALALWTYRSWETARSLPLRGPLVAAIALSVAPVLWRIAEIPLAHLRRARTGLRRATVAALPIGLLALVIALGHSASVTKAAASYTGLGGPIARTIRKGFDWDRDGYARVLGGGDCDDGDRLVHPGALEVPEDGIDQNCIGGDPSLAAPARDPAFVPVPSTVPSELNVLLITIDTVRADHFSSYGYRRKTTPNLDSVAAAGTVFLHGWAHAPSTRYSIPAILTGRLPLDVFYDTSVEGWPGLSPTATTIAEIMAGAGLITGALTNYWYFDKVRRMDQGFASYDNSSAALHASVSGAGPEQTKGSSSQQQTDKAIAFVQANAGRRWFLWVHYYDPHYAYEPHQGTPSFGTSRVDLYDGEIAFTDHHIGRLLAELRGKGIYDKTAIVVTGDHGEGFGEHGIELHGYHLYAPQTKVPMIVRVPGIEPRRSAVPAGHVDLLPTLANLVGAPPAQEMMGQSLLGPMTGVERERIVFQQLSFEGNHELRGGASRDCHVIYNVSPDPGWEVYRLDHDPLETTDLAGDGDACASTRQAVERWVDADQIPRGAAEALLAARPEVARPLDADLDGRVRLLGVDAPATVKRGEPFELTWTFEARGTVAPGWKMFVHVEGATKSTFINGDHRPARPFEWWRPGQFIRYKTTLTVPRNAPAGTLTVWAGMFKGKQRAPIVAPNATLRDHAVRVATIEVAP